ncbi:actin-binding protein IPP-like [Glandiceps talaboti]
MVYDQTLISALYASFFEITMAAVASDLIDERLHFVSGYHANSLLTRLGRLRTCNEFCDVHLRVGNELFECHRVVLSACSPYFHVMFTGGMSEMKQSEVEILGIDSVIFTLLINFVYTGEIDVNPTNVQELLAAADMLELKEVVEACCTFLQSQLHPSNCVGIYKLSKVHACTELRTATESFIHAHFTDVVQEEEFCGLSADELVQFLQSEDLRIETEFQVFHAAIAWIMHDAANRRKFLIQILEPIRVALIPPKLLFNHIQECTDLSLRVAMAMLLAEFNPDRKPQPSKPVRSLTNKTLVQVKPRTSARKHLYMIGGYMRPPGGRWSDTKSLDVVEQFDSFNEVWSLKPSLQFSRSHHGVAVVEGSIYVIGGESDSLIYDNVERYDIMSNKWVDAPSLTVPRCGHGVCTIGQVIYVFGGWIGSEIGNTVECYDPDYGKWYQIGKMETLRSSFGIAELDGMIYCVAGISDLNTELRTADCFDPVTREWSKLPDLKSRRAYVAVGVLNGCLYAVGGWNDRKDALCSVEKYSPQEKKWTQIQAMTTPRAGASVAAVNGLLYVIGGRTSSKEHTAPVTLDTVECYDPETNSWLQVGSMSVGRCEASVAVL